MYHLSNNINLSKLTPKVPECLVDRVFSLEENTIPRVCFSNSIYNCLLGLQIKADDFKDCDIITPEMYDAAQAIDILTLDAPACMPEEYHKDNVIESYREYYRLGKKHIHSWTNTSVPEWINN